MPPARRELVVPLNFGMTELEPTVAAGFAALRAKLTTVGWTVREVEMPVLEAYRSLPVWQFSAFESLRRFGGADGRARR